MKKLDLIDEMSRTTALTKKQAAVALDALQAVVYELLEQGSPIKIPGIGTLETLKVRQRTGRDPRDGSPITIPARTRVTFQASSTLRRHLNP